jgi:hypothetical protein
MGACPFKFPSHPQSSTDLGSEAARDFPPVEGEGEEAEDSLEPFLTDAHPFG